MTSSLTEIIETFAEVDSALRVELLLDYAKKLPPLPERLHGQLAAGANRIHECMTPVFLWAESSDGEHVHLHVHVAEEAPTIQGFAGIVLSALDGATKAEFARLPEDLLHRLCLDDILRMNRRVGIAAFLGRVKREAAMA